MTPIIPFLDLAAMHREVADELELAWRTVNARSAYIGGEFVERFEAEWAEYCGTKYCVGTSDGTAALELALRALGIGPGDEVIAPANTFIATIEAIIAVGARPVMVDVDPDTLLITAEHIEAACSPRTSAVIVVHLFGQPADMDAVSRVARSRGIAVVEDAAQAHGATWRGRRVGGLSDIASFSFYPGKNLGALGDAGAVVTDRQDLASRIRCLGNHGRDPVASDRHILVGRNGRLDGLQAAILSVKLRRLEGWNAQRRRIAGRYAQALDGSPIAMVATAPGAVSCHHLAVVRIKEREQVRRTLGAEGIATGIHYAIPCHRQAALAEFAGSPLPVVEAAADRFFSLPIFPQMTDHQIDVVVGALRRAVDYRDSPVTVAA